MSTSGLDTHVHTYMHPELLQLGKEMHVCHPSTWKADQELKASFDCIATLRPDWAT